VCLVVCLRQALCLGRDGLSALVSRGRLRAFAEDVYPAGHANTDTQRSARHPGRQAHAAPLIRPV
jgi:hypothetical protein